MTKARIDFDMPKHCDDGCYCMHDGDPWKCIHHNLDEQYGRILNDDCFEQRPNWCPLIEVKE
jgi:hypothetical protein